MTTSSTKKIRIDKCICDTSVQRALDVGWVARKTKEGFIPDGVGVPIISHRDDDTYHIVDGQHRIALANAAGHSDMNLTCMVYEGLTREDEAQLFRILNDRRSVQPITRWLVGVVEKDKKLVRLNEILNSQGWTVGSYRTKGTVQAVAAIHWVCDMGDGEKYNLVDLTTQVVTAAWGHDPSAMRAEIVKGIGMVLALYEGTIDVPTLVKRLSMYEIGPAGLISSARGLKALRGGRISDCVADIVITLYNTKRSANRLPTWTPWKGLPE